MTERLQYKCTKGRNSLAGGAETGNEFIINIKDSSVLSVIGCMDLMYATTTVSGIYFKALETYCIAAIVYLILTYFSSMLMKAISRKLDTVAKDIPSSN